MPKRGCRMSWTGHPAPDDMAKKQKRFDLENWLRGFLVRMYGPEEGQRLLAQYYQHEKQD